jgi:hypothetical protein
LEPMPTRPRISPAAFSLVQQGLHDAGRASRNIDRLVSLEPSSHVAGAAPDRSLSLKPREALLVTVLLADSLASRERNDFGDWRVAIVYDNRTPSANVIEIARKAITEFGDLSFFHDSWIIAKSALSG